MVLAEVAHLDAAAELRRRAACESEHLAAVPGVADARGAVHVDPE